MQKAGPVNNCVTGSWRGQGQQKRQPLLRRLPLAWIVWNIIHSLDVRNRAACLQWAEAQKRLARPRALRELPLQSSNPELDSGSEPTLVTAAAARSPGACAAACAAAFTRLVAVPAKHRPIATRLKRHCCRLAATRTNHRCSCGRSRTVAGAPLVLLLCLTAILATLRGRITTFLEERLICSGEGKVLPAIAARK